MRTSGSVAALRLAWALVLGLACLPAVAEDRCAGCDGSGTVTRSCAACGGTGIGERTERRTHGCEACGGERGDGIYTGRQGSGVSTVRCPACDGSGETPRAVAARRERQRAASEAHRRRTEEEAGRRHEARQRELRERNERLQRELKTSAGGPLALKTGADPRESILGSATRDTGEGFRIQPTLDVAKGVVHINDEAFERVRAAAWLLEKAEARGKDDTEARFLREQAGKALRGERLEVVVPPSDRTASVVAEYKGLAVSAAIGQSRERHFAARLAELETRVEQLRKPEADPAEHARAGAEWVRFAAEHRAALEAAEADLRKVDEYLAGHPSLPVHKSAARPVPKPELRTGTPCGCKGDGCGCVRPLCGGTRLCGCKAMLTDCACSRALCRFAGVEWCCSGSHADGEIQRCQTTCSCKHPQGGCACTVSCTCSRREKP